MKAIRVYSLPSDKLFASISSIIIKTLEYLASISTFTEAEYNKLVKPIFNLVLSRCYICRIILLVIKYGSRDSIGLGFKNLFHTQRISKLTIFIEEQVSDTLFSLLIKTNFEAELVNLGIGGYYLFRVDYETY